MKQLAQHRIRVKGFVRDASGAAAMEFALIALPLLMFTFGTIEIGRALFTQHQLFQATDIAARQLYLRPALGTTDLAKTISDNVFLADPDNVDVTLSDIAPVDGAPNLGTRTLTVEYTFQSVVPRLVFSAIDMEFERTVVVER